MGLVNIVNNSVIVCGRVTTKCLAQEKTVHPSNRPSNRLTVKLTV